MLNELFGSCCVDEVEVFFDFYFLVLHFNSITQQPYLEQKKIGKPKEPTKKNGIW